MGGGSAGVLVSGQGVGLGGYRGFRGGPLSLWFTTPDTCPHKWQLIVHCRVKVTTNLHHKRYLGATPAKRWANISEALSQSGFNRGNIMLDNKFNEGSFHFRLISHRKFHHCYTVMTFSRFK